MTYFDRLLRACASRSPPEKSFLASLQRRAAQWIVPGLPMGLAVSDLSRIGLIGAAATAAALVFCHWAPVLVAVVPLGMAVNWFGASLDGPLANYRRDFGKKTNLTDNLTDFLSLLLVIMAYGFSPFFTLQSAAVIMSCFLLFSAYNYLRSASGHVEQMALIGLGATEFRLLLAFWPFLARALGLRSIAEGAGDNLNVAIAFLGAIAILSLIAKVVVDAQKIASVRN